MKHLHLIIFVFSLCFSITASALDPWQEVVNHINYKESKIILPPFCGVNVDPKYKNVDWNKKFGGRNEYLNHYCDGKAKMPVCYKYPEKEKKACLTSMLEGTAYAIEHSPPNHGLLPFLYTERGDLLKDIGRYPEAIRSYDTAIQQNKKYVRAYAMLADTYILTKQYDDAEQIINEGLKYNKSPALAKRLDKINTQKK